MGSEIQERHTFFQINEDGKYEEIDEDTGEILHVQDADLITSTKKGIYDFHQPVADALCQRIAEGGYMTNLCGADGVPPYPIIARWRRNNMDFRAALKMACADRAELFHDKAMLEAEKNMHKDDVAVHKLKIDTLKWGAEKGDSDTYGAKTKISGDINIPTTTIIMTGVPQPDEPKDVTPKGIETSEEESPEEDEPEEVNE